MGIRKLGLPTSTSSLECAPSLSIQPAPRLQRLAVDGDGDDDDDVDDVDGDNDGGDADDDDDDDDAVADDPSDSFLL